MKKAVILCEESFQDAELIYPLYRLREAGIKVMIAGPEKGYYKGKYGYPVRAEIGIKGLKASNFDLVVIPGGWAPDKLRRYEFINDFVRDMFHQGKVVASICHGASVLVSANILEGTKLTCFMAIKDDVINAGGDYVDEKVVVDKNLITSRKPDDLPDFCKEILKKLKI